MSVDERLEEIMAEHRFLQILTTPWKQQAAYKLGIINENGKIIRNRHELTESHERQAYPDIFYAYCWNVKRLVEQVFTNNLDTNNFVKSVWALKTQYGGSTPEKFETHILNYLEEKGVSREQLSAILMVETPDFKTNAPLMDTTFGIPLYKANKRIATLKELRKMTEDGAVAAPANNVGGGQMAGVSPGQEPPMPKTTAMKKRKRIQRRQQDRIKQDIQTINIIKPKN